MYCYCKILFYKNLKKSARVCALFGGKCNLFRIFAILKWTWMESNTFCASPLLYFFFLPRHPWVPSKSFSPFCPAIWPAIGNIYTNVLFYYIDIEDLLVNYPEVGRLGSVRFLYSFCLFLYNNSKKKYFFVLKNIANFPSISFVFSVNNRSAKSFIQ